MRRIIKEPWAMIEVTQADRDLLTLIYSGTFKFNPKREKQALQEIASHRIAAEKAVLDKAWSLANGMGVISVAKLEVMLEK
jgi:hypothetical protein